jgi:hypothetical protein
MTSVRRPSLDFRANSIGNFGPSGFHLSMIVERTPGLSIKEPQANTAIFLVIFPEVVFPLL